MPDLVASDLVPVRRALISVSDKTGLLPFARALRDEFNVELISTGGTATALRQAGLQVTQVDQLTGVPEMMGGRVKTLHPLIHGALLARRDDPQDVAAMAAHKIQPIDLLCVNLYPFQQTAARADATDQEVLEQIDIGGPAMIRSAAKNHRWVLVVTSPERYEKVLGDLRQHGGSSCGKHRLKQAQAAFAHTAEYDRAVAAFFAQKLPQPAPSPPGLPSSRPWEATHLDLSLRRAAVLRYGENPHQSAALFIGSPPAEASVAFSRQLHGKPLSYTNLLDADAALSCVKEFDEPAACIVKHATPCGCAVAAEISDAFTRAYQGDPLAAFGGIVALNRLLDAKAAAAIAAVDKLLEVIVAPDFDERALALLGARWKNIRLLATDSQGPAGSRPIAPADRDPTQFMAHKIVGGWLIQERDLRGADTSAWRVVSRRAPSAEQLRDLAFAWLVCKHVKSNAIVIAAARTLLGAGAGQMDRPSAARLALAKAAGHARGAVAASDAFFPFPDALQLLLEAGVTAVVQPGGAQREQEVIAAADQAGAALVFTGERHFRH
jgi:phosphoribosylaminoimidazolecarboxamide formyltransferase/IMP cyclohydrolase